LNRIVQALGAIIFLILGINIALALVQQLPTMYKVTAYALIVGGLLLLMFGILRNITRQSRPKLTGGINRAEFYGVIAALFGWIQIWIFNLQNRIDSIYQILMG